MRNSAAPGPSWKTVPEPLTRRKAAATGENDWRFVGGEEKIRLELPTTPGDANKCALSPALLHRADRRACRAWTTRAQGPSPALRSHERPAGRKLRQPCSRGSTILSVAARLLAP